MTVKDVVVNDIHFFEHVCTNLSCYGGVVPSSDNMQQLVDCASEIERTFNLKLPYISGGSSSSLPLMAAGKMPSRINHVRIGEVILLGRETIHRTAWPDTFKRCRSVAAA